ncbi:DUF4351 domain-containing protein [Lyngbya confervoides]|uniref:DUF4351 domain-containing protein n=1 Tax=Lyngbya confervoides TaxID=207921 RepID=UPI0032D58C23
MLDLKDTTLRETRFYQEVLEEGRQEGRQKGRQEGRQEGEAELVLRQLTRRCGVLSATQQAQIRAFPPAQLEALGEALLDFTGRLDLEVWLEQRD